MTCNFTDGLDPELGKAMLAQHWAANGSHDGAAGKREMLDKITAAPAKGVVTRVPGPAPFDQECDDPRWDENRRT